MNTARYIAVGKKKFVCRECGAVVSWFAVHDALHIQIRQLMDRLSPPVSKIETSGHGDACRCGDCLCTYRPGEPHEDPCDCDDCRAQPTLHRHPDTPTDEPAVGSVARCTGCGNVFVHQSHGWLNTDNPMRTDSWQNLANSFCGPVKVIYNPEEDK